MSTKYGGVREDSDSGGNSEDDHDKLKHTHIGAGCDPLGYPLPTMKYAVCEIFIDDNFFLVHPGWVYRDEDAYWVRMPPRSTYIVKGQVNETTLRKYVNAAMKPQSDWEDYALRRCPDCYEGK
jgi:hypothetical protein